MNQLIKHQPVMTRKSELKINGLSKRESEIAKLIADGSTNPMIAIQLNISEHTVNTHRKNIFKKLEVHNIASLVKTTMKRKK